MKPMDFIIETEERYEEFLEQNELTDSDTSREQYIEARQDAYSEYEQQVNEENLNEGRKAGEY